MRIAIAHDVAFPIQAYGGTERVITWLAKGLGELGVDVTLICKPGSTHPYAKTASLDWKKPLENQIDVDLIHYISPPPLTPSRPYLLNIHGNGKPNEVFLPNTVFVSRNHAERHGSDQYVYNGLDPSEYEFSERGKNGLVFLAKASWKVKNVKGAIRIAKKTKQSLEIIGGRSWLPSFHSIHWKGMIAGPTKSRLLAQAKWLVFPVIWDEPFGLAVIEALVSGTAVLASPYGSLPELVPSQVGKICPSEKDFIDTVLEDRPPSPKTCREWVMENFTYKQMAQGYLAKYETILNGRALNPQNPKVLTAPRQYSL